MLKQILGDSKSHHVLWICIGLFMFKLFFLLFVWRLCDLDVLSVDDFLRVWVSIQTYKHQTFTLEPYFFPFYHLIYGGLLNLTNNVYPGTNVLTMLFSSISIVLTYLLLIKMGLKNRPAVFVAMACNFQPLLIWMGCVPLSESLAIMLLLLALLGLHSQHRWQNMMGGLALAAYAFTRLEGLLIWLLVMISVLLKKEFFNRRLFIFSSALGPVAFVYWQLTLDEPFYAFAFASYAANQIPKGMAFIKTQEALFKSFWTLLMLMCLPLFAFFNFAKFKLHGLFFLLVCVGLLLVYGPMFGLGYYPMVYAYRATFLLLFWIVFFGLYLFVSGSLYVTKMNWVLMLGLLINFVLCFFPIREVRGETLELAKVIKKNHERSVLLEKQDLGWTVVWGINADHRGLYFDRDYFNQRKRFTNPSWLKAKFDQYECFVAVSNEAKWLLIKLKNEKKLNRLVHQDQKYLMLCK